MKKRRRRRRKRNVRTFGVRGNAGGGGIGESATRDGWQETASVHAINVKP